jgi:hypothetical protein
MPKHTSNIKKTHGHNWSHTSHYKNLLYCNKNNKNKNSNNEECPCCLADKQKKENEYQFGACSICLNN